MTSTRLFLAFFLSGCLVLAGSMLFLANADYDYHFQYEGATDRQPYGGSTDYRSLPPDQQALVDGAMAGTRYTFQEPRPTPPDAVRIDGTYHQFSSYRTFDWSDPRTFGPALLSIAGLLGAIQTIRVDVRGGRPHTPAWRRWLNRVRSD